MFETVQKISVIVIWILACLMPILMRKIDPSMEKGYRYWALFIAIWFSIMNMFVI